MKPTKLWYIERFNLFNGIEQPDKEELARIAVMEQKLKGSYAYSSSDPANSIFLLKEGHIKISKLTEDGKEITLTILCPGEIFGEMALVDESPRDHDARAIDDVLLCEFKKRDLEHFIELRPGMALRITRLIGLRLRKMETKVLDLICKDVRTRVCELLLSLADWYGKPTPGRREWKINLTHQDIANLVGVSRQITTQTLDRLKSQGIIDLRHGWIIIRDRSRLEALVHSKTAAKRLDN
jgi:CRP/FNR family transcriptional regulator, cyclic AMP receptor protein